MSDLQEIMQQIKMDLNHSDTHYFITGYYIFSEDQTFASIHFHQDSVFNLTIENDFLCTDVILDQHYPSDLSHVQIYFSKIWTVAKASSISLTGEHIIYTNLNALSIDS